MRWLSNLPDWIKGTIALVVAVVGFIAFARDNLYPTITVTGGLILLFILIFSSYIAFSRKKSEFGKDGYTWKFPGCRAMAFIGIALALVSSTALSVLQPSRDFIIASFVGTSTPSPTSTPTPTPDPLSTATFTVCRIQEMTDEETIVKLIRAEADASNEEDIAVMQSIFTPDAVFSDYVSFPSNPPQLWVGVLARYQDDLFKNADFKQVEHFDILPVGEGISGDMAWYTSGSKGFYRIIGGDWQEFNNGSLVSIPPTQYGSEHWILKKNSDGCWVIVQMEFNAGHVKFPR